MERVYITGASGFVGQHLLKSAPKGVQILAQYNRSPITKHLNHHIQSIQQDLTTDSLEHVQAFAPDVILHVAAQSSIDECELNPEKARAINVEATRRLVELARSLGARFIFTSSDVVFDGTQGNYREEHPVHPVNTYARTKVEAEALIQETLDNYVIVRPGLIYGRSLNGRPNFTEFMYKSLKAGKPVFLFTDQYRTPILVDVLADILWQLAGRSESGVFHVGGANRLSRYEMGQVLCSLFNLPRNLIRGIPSFAGKQVAPRPLDTSLDSTRIQQLLNRSLPTFEEGIQLAFH